MVKIARGHMKERTWLKEIQEGKGKEYAWDFFVEPTTEKIISQKLYPDKNNYPGVSHKFNKWKNVNPKLFNIETRWSERENRWKSTYKYPDSYYTFNLQPLFFYALERGVKFSDTQKGILTFLFRDRDIRKFIYDRYWGGSKRLERKKCAVKLSYAEELKEDTKKEDFIAASIKFYFANFFRHNSLPKIYHLKEYSKKIKELSKNASNFDWDSERRKFVVYPNENLSFEEVNNTFTKEEWNSYTPKQKKQWEEDSKWIMTKMKESEPDVLRVSGVKNKKILINAYFFYYQEFHKEIPEVMQDLDLKMLKLLNLD